MLTIIYMNRTIKYRQPMVIEELKFVEWHYWWFFKEGQFIWPVPNFNLPNYEFTWCLDKNWKEIYEGDILKIISKTWYSDHWSEWWVQIDGVEPEVDVSYAQVKQKWNAWTIPILHGYEHEDWTCACVVDREIEIVWNIYQNPELLK